MERKAGRHQVARGPENLSFDPNVIVKNVSNQYNSSPVFCRSKKDDHSVLQDDNSDDSRHNLLESINSSVKIYGEVSMNISFDE